MTRNKQGQINQVGLFIMVAIVIIVGAILLQATAQSAGSVTNTYAINETFVAANNTLYTFTGFKAVNAVVIYNATGGFAIGAGNYTVTNNVITDGALTTTVAVNYSSAVYAGGGWDLSGTAQPTTYGDGAGRAVTGLIIVFMALALLAAVLYPIYQGGLQNIIGN